MEVSSRSGSAALALLFWPASAHASSGGGLEEFFLAAGFAATAGAVLGAMNGRVRPQPFSGFGDSTACGPQSLWGHCTAVPELSSRPTNSQGCPIPSNSQPMLGSRCVLENSFA